MELMKTLRSICPDLDLSRTIGDSVVVRYTNNTHITATLIHDCNGYLSVSCICCVIISGRNKKICTEAIPCTVNALQKAGIKFYVRTCYSVDELAKKLLPEYVKPFCIIQYTLNFGNYSKDLYLLTSGSNYENCSCIFIEGFMSVDNSQHVLSMNDISGDHKYSELIEYVFDCNNKKYLPPYELLYQLHSATIVPAKRAI